MKPSLRDRIVRSVAFCGLLAGVCSAAPATTEVTIHDDKPFPESLTSTSDGTLIIGSMGKGMVFRAPKGSAMAEPWIKPGANGLQRVTGVLADERGKTLWVCSSKVGQGGPTALKTFDLKTGDPKGSYDFPGNNSFCNDIAVGADGTVYATDTTGGRVVKLKSGGSALEQWIKDPALASADGIGFGDNATLYVNTYNTGKLVRIPINKDGSPGSATTLQTSQPLKNPDGMRPIGKNQFLLIKGAGKLDRVTISGDTAKIDVLKDNFNGPTAVTTVHATAWVVEGKLNYMNDPKMRTQDPGTFKAFAVPFGKH